MKKGLQVCVSTVVLACTALGLSGCGRSQESTASIAGTGEAITVENCGNTWTFPHAPERVAVIKNTVPLTLSKLGVLDRVTTRAGQFPADYYPASVNQQLAKIPSLTDRLNASGHLQISRETMMQADADLVVGITDTVNAHTMQATGKAVIEEPSLCENSTQRPSWDAVFEHVNLYGKLFNVPDRADNYNAQLRQRIAQLERNAAGEGKSVAVVFPSVGGGPLYAYGAESMATQVASSAGLRSVFSDTKKRVFEVSAEEVIASDPDVIVVLHSQGDGHAEVEELESMNGVETMRAVRNNQVHPVLLNKFDPPTPLAVDGLGELNDFLKGNADA